MTRLIGSVLVLMLAAGCEDKVGATKEYVDQAVATHAAQPDVHHPKTTDASELTTGTLANARLPSQINATVFGYTTPRTGTRRIGSTDFRADTEGNPGIALNYARDRMAPNIVDGATSAIAHVPLPPGATVTRFACTWELNMAALGTIVADLNKFSPAQAIPTGTIASLSQAAPVDLMEVSTTAITTGTPQPDEDVLIELTFNTGIDTNDFFYQVKNCIVDFTVTSVVP